MQQLNLTRAARAAPPLEPPASFVRTALGPHQLGRKISDKALLCQLDVRLRRKLKVSVKWLPC
jgi:hypothetical protein